MTAVQTATGPVDHSALGVTLPHEHLVIHSTGLQQQYPWLYDREASIERATAELVRGREGGVGTIVEVSPPDLGRDVRMIEEISRRAGVRVVACTGIWLEIPRWFEAASVDQIADVFAHEIQQGIADTTIRAGVIKLANGRSLGIEDVQERVLRGAARAAIRTRVPITTHTSPYDIGRDQMRIFDDEGLPPHLVAIGHAFTDDLEYLHAVLDGGRYVSIDHFRPGREDQEGVLRAIARLCADGLAGRIMLSHDNVAEWDGQPYAGRTEFGYTYVPTEVRARLTEIGVSEADIEAMLVTAPANFLAGGREE